jgi:hypothetical protein
MSNSRRKENIIHVHTTILFFKGYNPLQAALLRKTIECQQELENMWDVLPTYIPFFEIYPVRCSYFYQLKSV